MATISHKSNNKITRQIIVWGETTRLYRETLRMGSYKHKILKSSQLPSNAKPNNKFNIRLQMFGHQYSIDEIVSLIKSLDNSRNLGMFPHLYLLTIHINCYTNLEIKTNLVLFLRIFTSFNWIKEWFETIEFILC